ncbi:hypothetical protein OPV22_020671 [Ensete ventricosum]|uniref:Uncharacterized protein n=1 Tax=Ensete ventricosum TaxID=4639 RepID=A0AAV8QB08_ENSVE|nr:hypothetical protein OPV22_020671 [Ensete ventricosum]
MSLGGEPQILSVRPFRNARVGHILMTAATKHPTQVILEVDPNVDISVAASRRDATLDKLVSGVTVYAGHQIEDCRRIAPLIRCSQCFTVMKEETF